MTRRQPRTNGPATRYRCSAPTPVSLLVGVVSSPPRLYVDYYCCRLAGKRQLSAESRKSPQQFASFVFRVRRFYTDRVRTHRSHHRSPEQQRNLTCHTEDTCTRPSKAEKKKQNRGHKNKNEGYRPVGHLHCGATDVCVFLSVLPPLSKAWAASVRQGLSLPLWFPLSRRLHVPKAQLGVKKRRTRGFPKPRREQRRQRRHAPHCHQ